MKKTVSKKKRILCNLLMLLIALLLMDFLTGSVFLFPELQFRREERGHLLGPSTILGMEEIDHGPFRNMIIADDGDGVILWLWGEDLDRTQLKYREKYSDPMLMAAPGSLGYHFEDEIHVPIVLFDNEPRAARAEITFTVDIVSDDEEFVKTYLLEAQRTAQGYFLFTLDAVAKGAIGVGAEGSAVQWFVGVSSDTTSNNVEQIYPVQVRFYDILDHLIGEDTIEVRSMASLWLEEQNLGAG